MANVPDAAVGFLLENLKQFVEYNSNLIGGVNKNVTKLCLDLDNLKAFIKKYTERQSNNEILEKLANEVRMVVHEAEDAIETYIFCESLQKSRGTLGKGFHLLDYVSDLRKVGKQIEEVSAKVTDFYQNKAQLGLDALRIEETPGGSEKKKKKALVVEEENVVGFEDEAKKVIELLTGESAQLDVISIIGMLGLGKTTLAKKVLNDPKIEYEFYTRVFVNVSQEYERKEVFLNILGAFTQLTPEITMMDDVRIGEVLREHLRSRKYLIVMDDVWTTEAWDNLKVAFPNNNKHSRVLITSRNNPVAIYANPKLGPHHLRFLYQHESRELLRRKVFGQNSCPPELEEYELRILAKCDGLPLAIVVLAGILLNQRDRTDWWKKVADGVNDYVARDQSQSNEVIKLSFNHMPCQLKPCFLYFGVFQEDFEIPVWKLVRLWIAEGFIQRDGDLTLEDIAEDYLDDLVDRNLVMVGKRRSNGQIKTCRIHDTLRDFCKKEAMKENLFQEIKKFNLTTFLSEHPALDTYRRLCINYNVLVYIASKPSARRVRSFLSFAKEEISLPLDLISSIPKAFKLLRVLDIRSIIFNRFPSDLLYLVLLKYIAISCNFKILPEKFAYLRNMQTIIIETFSRSLEIRADLWKMALLRHLHTNASTYLQKCKGDSSANVNLQTMSTISPGSCTRELFERTPNLKKLGICGKLATVIQVNGESTLFESLVHLDSLENLKLLNDDITCKLHALPHENNFPRKLTRLTLLNTLLEWRHMSILGKLENLEVLKLKDNSFQGELWQTEGVFRRLKVLHVGSTNLVVWRASANNFPILTSLFLRHCGKLEAVPHGLADVSSLLNVDLYCTNPSVASSARKIQLLKLKVQAQEKNYKNSGFWLSVYPPDQ